MHLVRAFRGGRSLARALPGAAAAVVPALALLSLATTSAAACQQWRVPPSFVTVQGNRYKVTFVLKQRDSKVFGKAGYLTTKRTVIGNVRGGITGDRFFVRAYWTHSGLASIGVYMGTIDRHGFIRNGRTYDQNARPAAVATWTTSERMTCS